MTITTPHAKVYEAFVWLVSSTTYTNELSAGKPAPPGTIIVDPVSGTLLGVVDGNSLLQAYGGGGGGTPASIVSPKAVGTGVVGVATPYARQDHAHPINTAVDLNVVSVASIGWNAAANTGPTLTSGTAPASGINTYAVGTSGTTNLDGISTWSQGGPGVNPDLASFNGAVWTKISGSTVLGPYATPAALTSALAPGAGNAGARALVGAGVPYAVYTCDGTAWTSASGTPLAVAAPLTLSNANDGQPLICSGTPMLTINTGLKPSFGLPIKGNFATAGTAAISDIRQTTGTAECCLVPTDTTGAGLSYDLWGTK